MAVGILFYRFSKCLLLAVFYLIRYGETFCQCQVSIVSFDDVQTNGREISLRLRMIDNGSGQKFTDEYDGKELATIITDWVSENTVNHQFTEKQSTRNIMSFDQVRVPLFDERNKPQQAKQWVTKLQNYLKSNYNIISENNSSGLGSGRLYIGEK